jgi:hypothetical protein
VGNIFGEPQIFAFLHTLGQKETFEILIQSGHSRVRDGSNPELSCKVATRAVMQTAYGCVHLQQQAWLFAAQP